MKSIRFLMSLLLLFVVASCGGKKHLDLTGMVPMPQDRETVNVPKECEYLYGTKSYEVAVVEFANNTGYGDMTVKNRQTNAAGVSDTVGVGVGTGRVDRRGNYVGMGVGSSHTVSAYSSNSTEFMSQFAPSLGTFAQSVTEETLAQLGGVNLINRSHMDKILREQQFQMTLADPNSVMEFGRLSGVKYIFTGSVDNIQAQYTAPSSVSGNGSNLGMMVSALSAGYNAAASGWFVSTAMTLNLIDAETGKVIYSKTVKSKERATQSPNFQPDIIINTAKRIMGNAVQAAKNELTNIFEMNGYINEMRGGKKVVQINLGSEKGIHYGDVLDVYDVQVATDFLTKESKCNLVKLDARVTVSDQISSGGSWGYLEGAEAALRNVKIGSHVKRSAVGE